MEQILQEMIKALLTIVVGWYLLTLIADLILVLFYDEEPMDYGILWIIKKLRRYDK